MKFIYTILRRIILLCSAITLQVDPAYHMRRTLYGYAIRRVNGSLMYLDLKNDTGISKDLFIFKKREHVVTDYLMKEKIINLGDVVLDIGANIGYYALMESRLVGEKGAVYALEPVNNNYRLLLKNIELNGIKNISPFNIAAASQTGEGEIYVANKGNISSFVFNDEVSYKDKQKVKMISVNDFVSEQMIEPVLVRMDVEGFEKEIIMGMNNLLIKKPKLLIEVHPHIMKSEDTVSMFNIIENYGYTDAVVIKERNELWLKRDGTVKPSLAFLSRKIDGEKETLGIGKLEKMTLLDLKKTLEKRKSAFHVLLS